MNEFFMVINKLMQNLLKKNFEDLFCYTGNFCMEDFEVLSF